MNPNVWGTKLWVWKEGTAAVQDAGALFVAASRSINPPLYRAVSSPRRASSLSPACAASPLANEGDFADGSSHGRPGARLVPSGAFLPAPQSNARERVAGSSPENGSPARSPIPRLARNGGSPPSIPCSHADHRGRTSVQSSPQFHPRESPIGQAARQIQTRDWWKE